MSNRPQRSAAHRALEAIHQYYGVKEVQQQKIQPKVQQKKETVTQAEKDAFNAEVSKKIKESEKATTQEERRKIYVQLFEYIADHKKMLAYYPSVRTILTEKMREFDETIRKHVIQFSMPSIYDHISSLREITASVSHVSKDMEKKYQGKLRELQEVVSKYYDILHAVEVRNAMERLKRAIAEVNQST